MKVSVIVPIYNAEKYIERCVRSLFEQTFTDVEYIFVDDASTDSSLEILNRVVDAFPSMKSQIQVLTSEVNCGCNVTRRRGMKAATGEYMIHVDSDDYVAKDYLEKLVGAVQSDNSDIAICGIYYDYGSSIVPRNNTKVKSIVDCLDKILSGELHGSLCNKLIRSSLITENDIYPAEGVTMGEDKLILTKVLYYASKFTCVSDCLYYYNKTNDNSFTSQSKAVFIPSMIELTRQIKMFFEGKQIAESTHRAIDFHCALILGHVLIYGDASSINELDKEIKVPAQAIIKHPVQPIYYKVAELSHKFNLYVLIKLVRFIVEKFGHK